MKPTRTFDLLDRFTELFPGKTILSAKSGGKWIGYTSEQYHELSHQFCYGLVEMGFQPGDKIVTISNNRPEWNFVDMGMAMAGVVHVPVYTSMTAEEYRYIFKHSDARMIIVSDKRLFSLVKPVSESVDNIQKLMTFDQVKGSANWTEVTAIGAKSSDDIKKRARETKALVKPADLASIIYTSGTTGISKGVMLSHSNLVENFLAASSVFNLGPDDRFLSILPLCHVGGRLGNYQTQYSGAAIYYSESMGTIASDLRETGANGFDAVPRILEKIYDNVISKGRSLKGAKRAIFFWAVRLGLRYQPFGLNGRFYYMKLRIADRLIFSKWREALGGNARLVGCGGASLQPRLERIFWAAGLKILNMYGLTETSPIITINRQTADLCRLGTVGALIDGVEVKIADDGEILCKGHNIMMGYYKDREQTEQAFDSEGWFKTGDVGRWIDGKFLEVTDRKKEIFKLASGKYVAPQVIENRIKESLFIDQVMVIGEHQKFASSIVVPDFLYLKEWCKNEGITELQDNCDLISQPVIRDLFKAEVNKINRTLSDHEKVMRIRLVPDIWGPVSGELSASLKLKRKVIESKYQDLIDNIYMRG